MEIFRILEATPRPGRRAPEAQRWLSSTARLSQREAYDMVLGRGSIYPYQLPEGLTLEDVAESLGDFGYEVVIHNTAFAGGAGTYNAQTF